MMKAEEFFRSLSEPVRLRIAVLLLERELCVCDLMAVLKLPQSTVSRHMSRMKAAGLVTDRRDGKWVHYQFAPTPLAQEFRDFLRRNIADKNPYCQDHVKLKRYLMNKKKCT